ncbi:MAG: regulatory protein GemA [Alphaproteobacteria bacterium]|nr:MAG: regulatory protein GemA [Alphaproteobacteria bacterium]
MTRRAAVTKVQIARRDLGLDDSTYRAVLERLTGRSSSTACTDSQLGLVLDELKAKGWKPKAAAKASPRRASNPARHPLAMKARALWISLHQLGAVTDPSEAALESFARRQLGVARLQWAVPSEGAALIEALKAMAERVGWSQDVSGVPAAQQVHVLKARLAELLAQREA